MREYFVILLILLFAGSSLLAQLPANLIGSNPSSQRWKQINNEKVQVVFPEGQETSGLRVAQLVDYLWSHDTISIGSKRQKVSIFLQGERALSNGLVTVGPFRSELYQTPSQFANSTEYIDLLTIHEYRHVKQFANATQGITKLAKNVFGSWGWGGMMALALPRWYFEGDAVIAETAHTRSGRGRLPSFNMQYYAWYDADKNYSYEKAAAGSYNDYVPDWYPLGYNMLTYGRAHHGEDVWNKISSDAVRYKGLFIPFAKGIKRHMGMSTQELYKRSLADSKERWAKDIAGANVYDSFIKKEKSTVTNYTVPTPWNNSVIVAKNAYNEVGAFYKIDANGQWSNIYIYDLIANQKVKLTNKEKYFAPALSDKGDEIVAVEITADQKQRIVILNSSTGELTNKWENTDNYFLTHPSWTIDGDVIVVATKNEESSIAKINITSGKLEKLTKPAAVHLAHPEEYGGKIYYSASYEDVSNIYSVDVKTKALQKVTDVRGGAFQPAINSKEELLFTEFNADGYDISKTSLDNAEDYNISIEDKGAIHKHLDDHGATTIIPDLEDKEFDIRKYSKWSGLLKPHSIVPQWNDPVVNIRLLSDNKFSTMSAEAGASFNYNEDEWTYFAGLRYAELYPIINASFAKSYRSSFLFNFQEATDSSLVQTFFVERWSENRVTGGVTIPYNFSKGNMSNNLSLRANYQHASIDVEGRFDDPELNRDTIVFGEGNGSRLSTIYKEPLQDGSISTLDLSLSLSMIKRRAIQHVQPRLGMVLFSRVRKNIADNDLGGDVFFMGGDFYLPGLAKTHSFYINTFYQRESMLDNYRYGDVFDYPRGYNLSLRRDEFVKIGFNYSFPIAYPDIALGGLAFIKRIKGNAFLDIGSVGIKSFPFESRSQALNSFGFELGVDFRAFRLVEMDLGGRYSYLTNPDFAINGNRHQFDFFIISITQ